MQDSWKQVFIEATAKSPSAQQSQSYALWALCGRYDYIPLMPYASILLIGLRIGTMSIRQLLFCSPATGFPELRSALVPQIQV